MERCRCGFVDDGKTAHPCHGEWYTCKRPAAFRLYDPKFVSLAGMQMKAVARDTWACDACWDKFNNGPLSV